MEERKGGKRKMTTLRVKVGRQEWEVVYVISPPISQ
jgi:hypothetical protein